MFIGAFLWGMYSFDTCIINIQIKGQLSDRWGRRKTILINSFFTGIIALSSTFSFHWIFLMITRIFTGIGVSGAHVPFSLFSEFLPVRYRGVFLLFINLFWTCGVVIESGLAWLLLPTGTILGFSSWRWLLAFSALPTFMVLLMLPITPESPRYLYVSKRYDETERILKKAMRWNGKPELKGKLMTEEETELQNNSAEETRDLSIDTPNSSARISKKANFLLLFSKHFRRTTTLLLGIWFIMAFCYYGVIIMTPEYFKSNTSTETEPYLEVLITSLAEAPGVILAACLINNIGRKNTQLLLFLICGIFMLLLLIPTDIWLLTIFAVVSRMCIMGAFSTTFVFTPEVFPTIIRSTGLGTCTSCSRLGGIITPFIATAMFKINRWVPLIIYGLASIVGAILTLLVPIETAGRHLVDDLPPAVEKVSENFVPLQETPL